MEQIQIFVKRVINKLGIRGELQPMGPEGIKKMGHREYVGGMWEIIGKHQFQFLLDQGLQPHHYLVDIACGSLRAGVHIIPYLDPGHYLGIEKEGDLIELGIEKELGKELYEAKKPEFVVSDSFEIEKFSARPDYAIAQSLFTHLPPSLIHACFAKLRASINPDGVFFGTFNETKKVRVNPEDAHSHEFFAYTRGQMEAFGAENGWKAEYIGEWGHPRQQKMVKYRPA